MHVIYFRHYHPRLHQSIHQSINQSIRAGTWNIGVSSSVEKQLYNGGGSLLGGHLDGGAAELVPAVAMWNVVEFVACVQQQTSYLELF